MSTVIADLHGRRDIAPALVLLAAGPVPVGRLYVLVTASAGPLDAARFGDGWTHEVLDLLQRAGAGDLERDARGRLVLVPRAPLPSPGRRGTGS